MFVLEYIKNPKKVGAVTASSKYLAKEMMRLIDFKRAKVIVEYGPGTGVFTEKILARINEDTTVILVEINKNFYDELVRIYGYKKNVIIINDSAEKIEEILKERSIEEVDYIISGLPFASLPKEVSENILTSTKRLIKNKGEFITFQYTLMKERLINSYFDNTNYSYVIRNFPPAYVFRCDNKVSNRKYLDAKINKEG